MFDVYNTCLMYIIVQLYIRSTTDAFICHLERLVDHLHCMLAAIQSSRTLAHGVRWNICYCTALYSKYKQSYAPYQRELVTHLSGNLASYMPFRSACRSFTLLLAAIPSSRTLAHS